MCRGNWNGAKTKSMLFFLHPKMGAKIGHDESGERSNIRRMSSVETKKPHGR